MIPIMSHLTEY